MKSAFAPYVANPSGDACFATANPHATGAPARMADGRLMTDYRPRCQQYGTLAAQSWGVEDARARMTHGAEQLMEVARQMNNRKVAPVSCVDTMVPELYKRVCTWSGCKTIPGHHTGIGVGRIYVPAGAAIADNPQALSDMTIPHLAGTFTPQGPRIASQCGLGDAEQAWAIRGDVAAYGASARSHPYSAPRA